MKTKKRNPNLAPPWKPGQSGNPEGGRKHNPEKKRIKKVTNELLQDLVDLALSGNVSELKRIIADPTSPALKVGIATALFTAIKKGDWKTLESIVERIVGKVPVKVDHTSDGEKLNSPQVVLYLPKNGSTKEENE